MTKLEQLIDKLCPNGVEYKKLGDVANISRGGSFQKKDFCEDGVPCIHYGQIYTKYGLFTDKTLTFISEDAAKKQKYAVKNDIVMAVTSENIDDVCKCVAWLGDDEIAVSGHTAIIHHTLNPKYLCYYFHTAMFYAQKKKLAHGTKVIEVPPDKLADITIPAPPLEVQAEIVKILDEYTSSVTALQQELEKELTARKKQYEYYRDLLLDFGVHGGATSEYEWRTLGELCKIIVGGEAPNDCIRDSTGNDIYRFPVWGNGQDVYGYAKNYTVEKDAVCISSIGANTGAVFFHSGPFTPIIRLKVLVPVSNSINIRYLYHAVSIIDFAPKKSSVPNMSSNDIKKAKIPVPSLKKQEHIASILDRFDKLCNDISEGLPAEIEARRKQYEYYRDKLLSFEERG